MNETLYETMRLPSEGNRVYVILRHRDRQLSTKSKKKKEHLYVSADSIIQDDGHLLSENIKLYSSLGCTHD